MTLKRDAIKWLALTALCAGSVTAAETVYRWVDDSGVVHYSGNPPADRDYETVRAGMPSVGTRAAEALPARPETVASESAANAAEEPDPPTAEEIAAICAQARADIAQLEPTTRVLISDGNGGTRRLSDEERLQWLNTARQKAADNCN